MKITVLDGNHDESNEILERYLSELHAAARNSNHEMTVFSIRRMRINHCTGCWNCWLKTPGRCVHRDDAESIYRDIVNTDLLMFASPLQMGFVTTLTRKINERLIPLLLPYVDLFKGEFHHQLRYGKPPVLALLLQPERDTDDVDVDITAEIYQRTALNFRSRLGFVKLTSAPIREVLDEIDGI